MRSKKDSGKVTKHKSVSYAKWGYIFIAPFFIVYILCSLVPQFLTFYYSFFEKYRSGLKEIGPNFVGLANYVKLFQPDKVGTIPTLKYLGNTMIMWIMGAVPQFVIAMLLAVWFTSNRLKIKGQQFFKTVIYMPNLIMASAISMLFFAVFNQAGPIGILLNWNYETSVWGTRIMVAGINFLLWFGNTTIVLMAGIMGIDQSLFEAAQIDGASSWKVFTKVTLPLLMPIVNYAFITALIGGINMYDIPQVLTKGNGNPNNCAKTLIMCLSSYMGTSKNYGMGGALSVLIFMFAMVLSLFVYSFLAKQYKGQPSVYKKQKGGR